MTQSNHIGYVVSLNEHSIVVCNCCHQKEKNSPQKLPQGSKLFEENIKPYRQHCHMCNKIMVLGQTDAWCELYPADSPIA
jgi:hypothetical protein